MCEGGKLRIHIQMFSTFFFTSGLVHYMKLFTLQFLYTPQIDWILKVGIESMSLDKNIITYSLIIVNVVHIVGLQESIICTSPICTYGENQPSLLNTLVTFLYRLISFFYMQSWLCQLWLEKEIHIWLWRWHCVCVSGMSVNMLM